MLLYHPQALAYTRAPASDPNPQPRITETCPPLTQTPTYKNKNTNTTHWLVVPKQQQQNKPGQPRQSSKQGNSGISLNPKDFSTTQPSTLLQVPHQPFYPGPFKNRRLPVAEASPTGTPVDRSLASETLPDNLGPHFPNTSLALAKTRNRWTDSPLLCPPLSCSPHWGEGKHQCLCTSRESAYQSGFGSSEEDKFA